MPRNFAGLLGAAWFLLVTLGSIAHAQDASEYQVKAAFLVRFTRFIDWPDSSYTSGDGPFVIGVIGRDPFGSSLDRAVEGKSVGSHPVVLRRYHSLSEIQTCHILFISDSENDRVGKIVNYMSHSHTLIVGDVDQFIQRGGTVNFVIEDQRVHFEINPDAAERAGLSISSKLLALARIVHH